MSANQNGTVVVEDVHKSFGNVHALGGVSLKAESGKILGLLGPNGAGKTTLVRILTTLLRPDQGNVRVAGIDVLREPQRVRQIIGLAGQFPAVDEYLTGRENLVMVGQLYHLSRRVAKERAAELLRRFTLEEAADRPVKTYSGGMRRRLDVAASIVANPPVLFLDEPTTGLDPRTRKDLWVFIRELVSDGTTLMLTSQYLEEVDELADHIAVIDHGKLIAEGTSNELKAMMGNDILELRLKYPDQVASAADRLKTLAVDTPQIFEESALITLSVANGSQSLIQAVRLLDEAQYEVADLALRRPSLDEVFLAITGASTDPANPTTDVR